MDYPTIDNLPPIHPGEFLRDELDALHISARAFAAHVGVPANAITGILNGNRGVTAEMALRLARAFGTSEQYWTNLQSLFEIKKARATTKVDEITSLAARVQVDHRKQRVVLLAHKEQGLEPKRARRRVVEAAD